MGVPFTLDPVADLGLSPNNVTDGTMDYTISNATLCTVSYIWKTGNPTYSSTGKYRVYTVTATNTGTFTFSQRITYSRNAYSGTATMTYSINAVNVTGISIGSSSLSLSLGDTYTFPVTINHPDATTTLTWQSSNTNVATITDSGELTTKSLGTTTITCTAHNGVSTQCEVTVNPIFVSSIVLNQTEAELTVGEKIQLTATASPNNATDKSVSWSSSNQTVAVVNESGQVTAVGSGICNITATANDGSGVTGSCLITVLGNVMFCEDFGAVPGATITLPIQLTNSDAIQGFQFKLVLPEGVSVQTDNEGKLMATLTDRASSQGLEGADIGNGVYQFVYTSTNRILGTSGAVVNIPIVVANNVAVGQYDVIVKDVELVKYGTSSQIHHGDRTATLTIKEMTLGDVNGDGRVSVADAISIINYVLGRTPVSFIVIAADVNGDGDISLADAVATVDIILGNGGGNARAQTLPMTLDPQ